MLNKITKNTRATIFVTPTILKIIVKNNVEIAINNATVPIIDIRSFSRVIILSLFLQDKEPRLIYLNILALSTFR